MRINRATTESIGIRISAGDREEVGRARLYVMRNDLHSEPFGFLEDVFVREDARRRGLGSELVRAALDEADSRGCYKVVATSRYERPQVHRMYERLGFRAHGIEFRLDLPVSAPSQSDC